MRKYRTISFEHFNSFSSDLLLASHGSSPPSSSVFERFERFNNFILRTCVFADDKAVVMCTCGSYFAS